MAAKMTTVLCSCSWTGELPESAACPACKRDSTNRVTKTRLAPLLAIAGGTLTTLEPIVRIWLRDHGLIVRAGSATQPTPDGKQHSKRPKLSLVLTPGGQRVVDAHRAAAAVTSGKPRETGRWCQIHRTTDCDACAYAAAEYERQRKAEPDMRDEMP